MLRIAPLEMLVRFGLYLHELPFRPFGPLTFSFQGSEVISGRVQAVSSSSG